MLKLIRIRVVCTKLQDVDHLAAVSIVGVLKKSLRESRIDEGNYSKLRDKILDDGRGRKIEKQNVKRKKASNRVFNRNARHFSFDKTNEAKCFKYCTILDDPINIIESC